MSGYRVSGVGWRRRVAVVLLAFVAAVAMVVTMGVTGVGVPQAQAAGRMLSEGQYWTTLPNGIAPGRYQVNISDDRQGYTRVDVDTADGDTIGWYGMRRTTDTGIIDVPAGSYVMVKFGSVVFRQLQAYRNYGLYDVGAASTRGEGQYWSNLSNGIAPGRYQVNISDDRQGYTRVDVDDADGDNIGWYGMRRTTDTGIIDVPAGSYVKVKFGSVVFRKLSQRPGWQRVRDVSGSTPHQGEIIRLMQSGISSGWEESDGSVTYRPGEVVVRQDMAAFLYRLAGSPAFTPSTSDRNRFWDVSDQTPHAKEIWWLARTGITTGYRDGSFGGYRPIVRQDMAAFLKRLASYRHANPKLGANVSFRDVNGGTPHHEDIVWLARTGVTTGYRDGTFRGMVPVYRQDMAAFLIRMRTNVLR